ncbi:MAG: hypothetical protein GY895_08435 [Phycisphaera sp.]|nr:hypothetical protein [Phycisphaera sp.]
MRFESITAVPAAILASTILLASCGGESETPMAEAVPADRLDAGHRTAAGLLARYEYADAVDLLTEVVAGDPDRLDARVDLAIATMNRQLESDEQDALDMLEALQAEHPEDVRIAYLSGVLQQRAGEDEIAAVRFQKVIDLDAEDPYAWYHLGLVQERENPDSALLAYQQAVALDPYLRSGWYRIGSVAARLGRNDLSDSALATFERLETNPRAVSVKPIYGRLGTKAMASPHAMATQPRPRPEGDAWTEPASLRTDVPTKAWRIDDPTEPWWRTDASSRAVAAADLDDDGHLDLVIAGSLARGGNAVLMGSEDGHRIDRDHPLASIEDATFFCFGDIDHDGSVDAFVGRRGPDMLWLREEDGGWRDATKTAGIAGGDHLTVDGLMIDADHDGDLDLVAIAYDGPDRLWNNDRDGSFRDIAPEAGIGGDEGSLHVVAADLDGTRDLDLLIIREDPPHLVHLNDRLWSYNHDDPRFEALRSTDIHLATSGDLDGDGVMDLVTVDWSGSLARWMPDDDGDWAADPIRQVAYPPSNLVVMDQDGDGGLEPIVDDLLGIEDMAGWIPYLDDPAAGYAAVAVPRTGAAEPMLVDAGPGRWPFTAIELAGTEDATQSLRTNADGVGALIAARTDDRWTIKPNLRPGSGPGQSRQPIPFGLGGAPSLSYLLIDWPDGLFQGEVPGFGDGDRAGPTLAAGVVDRIPEIQRQVSSCPVLFAHDGNDFRFVSDVLGVAGIGYLLEPGVYSEPRPYERFPLPTGLLAADAEDRIRIVLCEPMEEACYLDAVELIGWRLPEGWSLTVDERLAIEGPAATGAPIFHRTTLDPIAAVDARGDGILDSIITTDRVAAPIPDLDRRFIGRLAEEHVVTFEFANAIPVAEPDARPWLLMDGWVEYPYAQTMFAAWQAEASYDSPSLEARDAEGRWHVVQANFGYPAGMPRTAAFPLDDLPPGCDALRLRTNQEIYWDRLRVVIGEPAPAQARRIVLQPDGSDFSAIGYPRRIDGPQRCPDYDWNDRSPLWDVRHQRGRYTRFGAVDELLASADGAVVTIGPGEGVEISFKAPGDTEDIHWILDCHGWCKDRDLFTRTGETLGPIPGERLRDAASQALLDSTRTRIEAGR